MSEAIDSLVLLCHCLGQGSATDRITPLQKRLEAGSADWAEMIRIADQHLLIPALSRALNDKGLDDVVSKDIGDFLARGYQLNCMRNERIKAQGEEIVKRLNALGVTPLMLKGGVHLFEVAPEDIGRRMMVDLDILIPDGKLDEAVQVLEDLGYEIVGDPLGWTYQYPPMRRGGDPAAIELHRAVGEQQAVLTVEAAWRDAVALPVEGCDLLALSPTHRVLHNTFHAQIQDRAHALGEFALKDLYDVVMIRGRHEDAIDWAAIRDKMRKQGLGAMLPAHLYQVAQLMGVPMPDAIPATLGARLHLRRCILQASRPGLKSMFGYWGAVTHPFKRYNIELLYGEAGNAVTLNAYRVKHALHLMRKFRGNIFQEIEKTRATHYDAG